MTGGASRARAGDAHESPLGQPAFCLVSKRFVYKSEFLKINHITTTTVSTNAC